MNTYPISTGIILRYADTVLIIDPEKKLKELMGKVEMESKKKGLTVKYKKTDSK